MPLAEGKSNQIIQGNIDIMIREYRRSGKIGNTTPDNLQHAYEIATAIAHQKAGR